MSCQQVSQPITTKAETLVTTEDQDPYVFTETVPTTPPVLFNAQKSRAKAFIETQTLTTEATTISTPTPSPTPTAPTIAPQAATAYTLIKAVANKRPTPPIVTTAAGANKLKFHQKLPLGPLNGNNTKTQTTSPILAAVATGNNNGNATAAMAPTTTMAISPAKTSIVKTTITQSRNTQQQQHKKLLNVCIVRPQLQQQQQLTATGRQQQQQSKVQQQKQRKQASSPPPLLQHTPSLWQTPLLLDTASVVVSPPTSPASLPSPPIPQAQSQPSMTATLTPEATLSPTTVTALVSPLITTSAATPLPPSNFHHNTLAQHLQKVECLKKPKKSIVCSENANGKPSPRHAEQAMVKSYQVQKQQQAPHHREIDAAKTVVVQPTNLLMPAHVKQQPQQQQQPAQLHKLVLATAPSAPPPLQAIQKAATAVTAPQHSDSDLNEIPVNVIFRKPQISEVLHTELGGGTNVNMTITSGNSTNATSTITNTKSSGNNGKVEVFKRGVSKNVRSAQTIKQSKPKTVAPAVTEVSTLTPSNVHPAPHVLQDFAFTHNATTKLASSNETSTLPAHFQNTPQQLQQQNMSSMAKTPPPQPSSSSSLQLQQKKQRQLLNYYTATPAQIASHPETSQIISTVQENTKAATSMVLPKQTTKRKISNTTSTSISTLIRSNNAMSPFLKKRTRKMEPLYSAYENQIFLNATSSLESNDNGQNKRNSHAVAVVKMSAEEIEADTSLLASAAILPYCIQKHWLYITREIQLVGGGSVSGRMGGAALGTTAKSVGNFTKLFASSSASERETRITQRKMILRRQALQLLNTQTLQKWPMQAARRRLMCVDRLLRKYARHDENVILVAKKCNYAGCHKDVLAMATQCEDHIVDNISQHVFLPCTAKFSDNTQCRIPVFDIIHDLPLCEEHARKRDAYNRSMHEQQRSTNNHNKLVSTVMASAINKKIALDSDAGELLLQLHQIQKQHKQQHSINNVAIMSKNKKQPTNIKITATARKRKASNVTPANTVGRPLKRTKKKITPNTLSSVGVVGASVAPLQLTSAVLKRKTSTTSLESMASNSQSSNSQPHYISSNMNIQGQTKIAMPALAPLSGRNVPVVSSTLAPTYIPKNTQSFSIGNVGGNGGVAQSTAIGGISQDLKPHEISQLVAQFSVAVNSNNNKSTNNTNNTTINENSNSLNAYSNNILNNSYNFIATNCDSNFTSTLGSSPSLPSSTEELFRQEMLSVCENSSVYASSEDTGLGGLSETELMVGPNDADDIPLGDTRLLEEHDLANVLSTLPEDAFNELFTAVHQEEREEVERALELADKHLKSLQQTIGTDIDFLGDFPDDDEILADTDAIVSSVMRSPDATSGIDTSTLFIDSGSNSAGGIGGGGIVVNASNITDIRGLVQT